jgi:hypothetical protein
MYNIILANTRQLMGCKFLTYSAFDNNCGHFVMAMLMSSNLSNPSNINFVEQTTAHLFTPQLRKITDTVTDTRGKIDILRQGGDIKPKKRWIEHIKKIAKENCVGYFKALSDPNCKSTCKRI